MGIRLVVVFLFTITAPLALGASSTVGGGPPPPAPSPYLTNPLRFVADFYDFALAIGGLLAFGAIVYGAVKYAVAAGNPSGQSDAKDQMTQALLGLVLLLSAFMILRFVNPDILTLRLPTLTALRGPLPPGTPGSGACLPACTAGKACVQGSCQTVTCTPACGVGGECVWANGRASCIYATQNPNCRPGNERFLCGRPLVRCQTPCVGTQSCQYTAAGGGYYTCKR